MFKLKSFLLIASSLLFIALCASQVHGSLIEPVGEPQHDNATSLTLEEQIGLEKTTFHWYPYKRMIFNVFEDGTMDRMCIQPNSSAEEFPNFLTREQRLQGFIAIHFFVAIYFFIMLAFICDKFFLPAIERICQVLNISPDVAATTFMATATSTPEFFTNTISIFIAESDMGLGAVIGSMLFNTLGVAACASLFTKKPIQIDWWPITRDSIIFSFNICVLVAIVWDSAVDWWETIILLFLYVCYWLLMFQNKKIMKFVKHIVEDRLMWCQRIKNYDVVNQKPFEVKPANDNQVENGHAPSEIESNRDGIRESYKSYNNEAFEGSTPNISIIERIKARDRSKSFDINSVDPPKRDRRASFDLTRIDEVEEEEFKIWELPRGVSWFDMIWYFVTWPIRFILHYTIPDPITQKKWVAVSFFMCIIWIGVVSYVVFWMIVLIGDTFNIPEAIMGFTLMAFGGCMPEAISAVIVARKGSGQMGVSNSLGANSLAVLFSLGMPWFIRTMADGAGFANNGKGAFIYIASEGMQFTIMGLLIAVAALYIIVSAAGFKLRKIVGGSLGICYILLATTAILFELNILSITDNDC